MLGWPTPSKKSPSYFGVTCSALYLMNGVKTAKIKIPG